MLKIDGIQYSVGKEQFNIIQFNNPTLCQSDARFAARGGFFMEVWLRVVAAIRAGLLFIGIIAEDSAPLHKLGREFLVGIPLDETRGGKLGNYTSV